MFVIKKSNGINFAFPPFIYAIIWGGLLFLYSLKVINYYEKLNWLTVITILATIFTFYFSWVLLIDNNVGSKKKNLNRKIPREIIKFFEQKIKIFNKIWITGVLLTILLQHGFPLLWMILGSSKTYADFGFASMQGLLNSFWLSSLVGYYLLWHSVKEKKYFKYIALMFIFPIIIVSRGLLILGFFELLAVYLFYKRISIKNIIKLILTIVIVIYIFGTIGDYRVKYNTKFLTDMVSSKYQKLFVYELPSGFTWTYLYFTASLDNINTNIHNLNPQYIPDKSVQTLFPTVIRSLIWTDKNYYTRYAMKMSNPLINTFTYLSGFLVDFGIVGTIIIVFFLQLFINQIYYKAKTGNIGAQLAYPALLSAIFLSVFANYFFTLVIIFQIYLGLMVGKALQRRIFANT